MSPLKKQSLSKDDMKNYKPVSNLNFVSKIIEKFIANQICSHLERNDISNQYHRKFHSTETAPLKVENDIILNMDEVKGHCTYSVRSVCCFRHSGPQQYHQSLVNLVCY